MKNENKLNGRVSNACQKVLAQISQRKNALLAQFQDLVAEHQQVLRLALNEAEALAWQTRYPHLVFQDLAEEKAQSVLNWVAHQRAVRPDAPAKI
jgi:hypothetical protein